MVRRLISMVLAVWVIATITFLLMHSVPGGPFSRDKALPPAIIRNLEARYHLDWPLWKQYVYQMYNILRWDFGPSMKYESRSVNQIIRDGFPISARLGAVAVALSIMVGLPVGIISALRHNRWQDNVAMGLATLGVALPSYVVAALFVYVFALKLGWFPSSLWGTPKHYVLPALALAGFPMAFIARLARSSMLEVLQQDYIRTARAKGLSERVVIYRHALKNSLIPVVTYIGPLIANVFTGSFVIERMFGIPGLGRHFITSIYNRDYTTIMGTTVFYSVFLVIMILVTDLTYALIDPRISIADERK